MCARARARPNRAASIAEIFDDALRRLAARAWRRCQRYCRGMVGSTIGWLEVPYLPCPAELDELAENPARVRDGVFIVSGMRCSNPLGAPDVMRGEETQLLGARYLDASLEAGAQLVCMPGTHTKWVSLHKGVVQEFLTAPTGELFAHAVRAQRAGARQGNAHRAPAARISSAGSRSRRTIRKCTLLHRLFQSRSLRIDKQLSAEGAASWMSGLLIGTDVARRAVPVSATLPRAAPVYVIGAPQLTESYSPRARAPRTQDRPHRGRQGRARRAHASCISSWSAKSHERQA